MPAYPVILHINHHFGGGTEWHVDQLTQFLAGRAKHLVLQSTNIQGQVSLSRITPSPNAGATFDARREFESLCQAIRNAGVNHVHIHQLFGLPLEVRKVIESLRLSFDFTVHDYHTVCPRVHLKNWENRYCGEPGAHVCNSCMRRRPDPPDPADPGAPDIFNYRERYEWVFSKARYVICPSGDVGCRVLRYYPGAPVVVASHSLLEDEKVVSPDAPPLAPDQPLRIAILGNLTSFKGAGMVAQCAELAQRENALLNFDLIGWSDVPLPWSPETSLTQIGPYRREELPGLLKQRTPHLIWFSVPVPETFSYTLSEAFSAGLAVVVPDLGVFPERVRGRPWTWIMPWGTSALGWLRFFLRVREDHFVPSVPPQLEALNRSTMEDLAPVSDFYRSRYLHGWSAIPDHQYLTS